MSRISTYEVAPVPKLADKLIGTSVGGEIEDITYNFTLSELLNLFLPNIPANNLQGVLDYGNTATQDINLNGTISTTNLEVTDSATILNSFLTGDTKIQGPLYDSLDSIGTAGQVLKSTGSGVEWYSIPEVIPTLQQVLSAGNTANIDIVLDANLQANTIAAYNAIVGSQLVVSGTLVDVNESSGSTGQVLASNSSGVEWVSLPVYTATSPLSINSITNVISIQKSDSTHDGYLSSSDWINFNGKQNAISLTTTGSSGAASFVGTVLNIPNYTLAGLDGVPQSRTLTINGVTYDLSANRSWTVTAGVSTVTATSPLFSTGGGNPDISIQQSSGSQDGYLSSTDWTTFNNKQAAGNYITSLTGEATASGPGAASVTLSNAAVIAKVLTGLNITGGTVVDTDSILTAFGKVQNQINGLIGGTIYKGVWNASTNTPALTSSVGTQGWYYIVNVSGNTNLNGITDWQVGDWAIFNGTVWNKVDNTDAVVSVNGQTGAVSLTTDNIPEGTTNLYYLDSRARAALSFTAGSGAYNSTTGIITIPTNTNQLTNGASFITLASLSASSPLSYSNTTGVFSISQATTSTNGYLSSTDWNTFNNKQNALTNPITGTGTTNTIAKFTGSTTLGNSIITESGSRIRVNGNGIEINGPATSYKELLFLTNLGARFNAYVIGAETGSNNGSTFYFSRYDDAGAYIDDVYSVDRATGNVSFGHNIYTNGSLTAVGINTSGGASFTGGSHTANAGSVLYYAFVSPSHEFAFGDGTGYSYKLVKRVGGVTTPLFTLTDSGVASISARLNINGAVDDSAIVLNSIGAFKNVGNIIVGTGGSTTNKYQLVFNEYSAANSYPSILVSTPTGTYFAGIGSNTSSDFVLGRSSAVNGNFVFQDIKISNSTGAVTLGTLSAGSAGNFVVSNSGTLVTRTAAQVLADIGAAPATGGTYLPLAGGTLTGALIGTSATFNVSSSGTNIEVLKLSNNGVGANTRAKLQFTIASTNYGFIAGGYGASAPQMQYSVNSGGNHLFEGDGVQIVGYLTVSSLVNLASRLNVNGASDNPSYALSVAGASSLIGLVNIGGGINGIRLGNIGDGSAYDNISITYSGYNAGAPEVVFTPRTTPGSGIITTFFRFKNSNGNSNPLNNFASVTIDGNLGIGESDPSYKLHVNGAGFFSSSVSTNTLIAPSGALTITGTVAAGRGRFVANSVIPTGAITDYTLAASAGLYGLYMGVTTGGISWLQSGREDTNTSYELKLNPNGGAITLGNSTTSPVTAPSSFTSPYVYAKAGLYINTGGTNDGGVNIIAGNPSHTGFIEWIKGTGGVRQAYMGYDNTNLTLVMESGDFNVTGTTNLGAMTATTGTFSGLATFTSGTIVPNGQYYRAVRTSGSASINILGIESATDNTVMVASNFFKFRNTGTGDAANLLTISTSGAGVFTSTVTATGFIVSSDLTLKNITSRIKSADGIDFLSWNWKDGRDGFIEHYGYGAQEVEKILPSTVYKNDTYSISIQEVQAYKIMKLEERILELEKQLM